MKKAKRYGKDARATEEKIVVGMVHYSTVELGHVYHTTGREIRPYKLPFPFAYCEQRWA